VLHPGFACCIDQVSVAITVGCLGTGRAVVETLDCRNHSRRARDSWLEAAGIAHVPLDDLDQICPEVLCPRPITSQDTDRHLPLRQQVNHTCAEATSSPSDEHHPAFLLAIVT